MTVELHIEAPTDAQLGYITDLCDKQGFVAPAVVASRREASQIITELRTGNYNSDEYEWPWSVPFV